MRFTIFPVLLLAGAALSGCATIVQGSTESLSVNTTPVEGASCTLTNSEGTWYLTSPGSVIVHKTKNDLTVDCKKDGYGVGHMVAPAHFGGTTVGNVLAGGIVGLAVDAASGANYHYHSPLTIQLGPPTGQSTATTATKPAKAPPAPTTGT